MATLTAARAAAGFPVSGPSYLGGVLQVAWGVYNLAANPTAADIIEFCKVPAGATVIGGFVQAADLDTNATEEIDFDIGWAANADEVADTDGFGNFGALTGDASVHLPVAGIYMPFANVIQDPGFKTFTAETTITGVINVDAATGGTGAIKVVVFYTCV